VSLKVINFKGSEMYLLAKFVPENSFLKKWGGF
jgi:hypothetical protein